MPADEQGTFICGALGADERKQLWSALVGQGRHRKKLFCRVHCQCLMEQEISVRMTNFSAILNDLTASFEGRNEYIEHLCRFPLLILDDFGMERGTEYGLEQVYNVIDSRYRSRKPLIVTTNLSLYGTAKSTGHRPRPYL